MATIQERTRQDGRTTYRVMVRVRGYPTQSATFDRKTDARDWAAQTETDIKRGRHFRTAEARKHTAAELIDRYREEILSAKPAHRRKDQERHLAWWESRIGSYLLSDVTPALLAEQKSALAAGVVTGGRRRSPGTVNRYLQTLNHAFAVAAREWGWMEENPLRKVARLREPRGRVRFLSDEERLRLLDACRRSSEPRLLPLVLMAIATGARRGELLRLRWSDVDFGRGVAIVHQTKNDERRSLPLAGPAIEALRSWSRVRRIDTDLIFANPDGAATFPQKAFERALRKADIDGFRFHDLRHTAASYLAMSGATLAEIAEVLGHKTLSMVKRYSHLTEAHTRGVVERMSARFLE